MTRTTHMKDSDSSETLSEFFKRHVEKIKKEKIKCQECNTRLKGNVSEVCHILPKQYFKSISKDDENIIYLCGLFSEEDCHYKFDNLSNKEFKKMGVYNYVSKKFENLLNILTEEINYKIRNRYE